MKLVCSIIFCAFFLSSCEKRSCECRDNIRVTWKDNTTLENISVIPPNAVLNIGAPLTINISSLSELDDWILKSAKIYQSDDVFVNNEDLDSFVEDNSTIRFSHDIFSSSNELIRGPVNIEIEIFFPEKEANLFLDGSIYYYGCEDINDEFNLEECRWPKPIPGQAQGSLC